MFLNLYLMKYYNLELAEMPAEIDFKNFQATSSEISIFANEKRLMEISNSDTLTDVQSNGANITIDRCSNNAEKIKETLSDAPKLGTETICIDSSVFNGKYRKKIPSDLTSYSLQELKILVNDLSKAVEEISNQLVKLLLENDALQQESDARNVAIEQLLRITVKVTENDLKPVQMSVILSSEECETST